ncbi:MAG: putative Ig domain-containing protein [Leptospiraceae bacterium]|nr:putative Ig domain-containing protein [Leptospiraceae bacterium]
MKVILYLIITILLMNCDNFKEKKDNSLIGPVPEGQGLIINLGITKMIIDAGNSGSGASTQQATTVSISYPTNPATYYVGKKIDDNIPTTTGDNLTFSSENTLPQGLVLNPSTGIISGTPTTATPGNIYKIIAVDSKNKTNENSISITITVVDAPPSSLTYSNPTSIYTKGVVITNNVPSSSGTAPTSYSISPSLPSGLIFNPSNGIISGAPEQLSTKTTYTITARNAYGETSTTISIEVVAPGTPTSSPSSIAYNTSQLTAKVGVAITNLNPTVSGIATSYSISPSLPTGLSLNTTTGVISGTPTEAKANTQYTITASNTYGSTNTTLSIEVKSGYQWTKIIKSTSTGKLDYFSRLEKDSLGNIYIAGMWNGTVNFAEDFGGSDSKTSKDGNTLGYDIFITKINADGTYGWTKTIGGSNTERMRDFQIVGDNIYIIGQFQDTVNFGTDFGSSDSKTGISAGAGSTGFITKITTSGSYVWTKVLCSTTTAIFISGKVYNTNIYLYGWYNATCNFRSDFSGTDTRSSNKDTNGFYTFDTFLTKITTDGGYQWTKIIGGNADNYVNEFKVSNNGNLYLMGRAYAGTINFASDFGSSDSKTLSANTTLFLTKINSNESYGWTKLIPYGGGLSIDNFRFTINSTEDIYISGANLIGTYNFGTPFGANDFLSSNDFHGTITKISKDASYYWSKRLGMRTSSSQTGSIQVDSFDNVYVTDNFRNSFNFAEDFGGVDNKSITNNNAAYISKIKYDGSYQWTKTFGNHDGTNSSTHLNTMITHGDYIYALGVISANNAVNFGKDFGSTDNKTSGSKDYSLFITKFENQ